MVQYVEKVKIKCNAWISFLKDALKCSARICRTQGSPKMAIF